MNIFEDLAFSDEKPSVLTLRNTDRINVIAIGLKAGQVLKKHVTPFPALLLVLKGRISFDMDGVQTELPLSGTFDIPANVSHEVRALEESIFVVTKEKP
jgi:quercetin dioxygenase-like cupin family protein